MFAVVSMLQQVVHYSRSVPRQALGLIVGNVDQSIPTTRQQAQQRALMTLLL